MKAVEVKIEFERKNDLLGLFLFTHIFLRNLEVLFCSLRKRPYDIISNLLNS